MDKLLNFHIALVANDYEAHFRVTVKLGLLKPPCYVVERLPIGDIVNQNSTGSRSIVTSGDWLEGLLPSLCYKRDIYCVPYLKLDALLTHSNHFGTELDSDGDFVFLSESMVDELQ